MRVIRYEVVLHVDVEVLSDGHVQRVSSYVDDVFDGYELKRHCDLCNDVSRAAVDDSEFYEAFVDLHLKPLAMADDYSS